MGFLTLEEIERNFIEERNLELWKNLDSEYIIGVNDNYQIYELKYIANDPHVVILTNKQYNLSLFTHELLHLELRHKGLHTTDFFQSLSQQFLNTMAYMILNCI